MITADELLHDPKYRGMTVDELKEAVLLNDDVSVDVFGDVGKRVAHFNKNTVLDNIKAYHDAHPLKPKTMKQKDIKHPMVLTLRNGDKLYVIPSDTTVWFGMKNRLWGLSSLSFTDDLLDVHGNKPFDIMKITLNGETIWEREEKVYSVWYSKGTGNKFLGNTDKNGLDRLRKLLNNS